MPLPSEQEKIALHAVYVTLHNTIRNNPDVFSAGQYTSAITHLMGGRGWSWRVVGITPRAQEQFQAQGFQKTARDGITRAHIIGRQDTCIQLFQADNILTVDEFFRTYLENDKTILCARGENRRNIPNVIHIENPNADLFPSARIGWRHGEAEINFLAGL